MYVCLILFPAATPVAPALPSPKSTSKEITLSPVGVMVTRPVLSWVISKLAPTFEGATIPKSVSSMKSSLQLIIAVKTKSKVKICFIVFMFVLIKY